MQLQGQLSEIAARGAELWTISPDPPERLQSYKEQNGFEFPMLVDGGLAVTKAYGILNEDSGEMPHPTAMIVDREGKITYFRVDEDYKVRPPTVAELLPALEAARGPADRQSGAQ